MGAGGIAAIIVGVVFVPLGVFVGYYFTKKIFMKELKKNPPITEKQIRAMYSQMGRKPSEKQIQATMRAMKNAK